MRIALLISLLFLAGCSTGAPVNQIAPSSGNMNAAQVRCLSKGNVRGSYAYETCYRNSPEVQAYERRGRMNNLNIINANRSPNTWQGRSYPVE